MKGGECVHRMSGFLFGVICIGLFGSLLVACSSRELDDSFVQQVPHFAETEQSSQDEKKETELIALAQDQEEAEEIAELYGIELLSFSDGVAVFTTDKELQDLMETGDINGYPTLTVNNAHYQLKEFTNETDASK